MNNVFVLGSINTDLVFKVNRIPKMGETIKSDDFFINAGGKGANQAVACAKQGVKTFMIGSIGSDILSQNCKKSLIDNFVDVDFVEEISSVNGGIAGIIIEAANNRILTYPGANIFHNEEKISRILQKNSRVGDYLLSQLEIPLNIVIEIFEKAKTLGLITVLNVAPAERIPNKLFSLVDILVVNEIELETLTNIRTDSQKNIDSAIKEILSKGAKSVLLTLGEKGSIYADKKIKIFQEAFSADVKDTTAAGDTYIGTLVSQLINENDIKKAMLYATAASTLAIQKYGAQSSIPNKKEVENFLKRKEINI